MSPGTHPSTAHSLHRLASVGCVLPEQYCEMVDRVVSGEVVPEDATALLMGRELKAEGPAAYED